MKYLKLLSVPALFFALAMIVTACGGDDESTTGGNGIENGGGGSIGGGGSKLTADQQKSILEQTGRELVAKVNSDDFKVITNIANYVKDNYTRESQSYALEDWLDAAMELTETQISSNVYKRLFLASNFAGAFNYNGYQWEQTRKGGNNLEFTFPDQNGTTCVATITPSGKVTQVHHEELDERDYDYYYNGSYYDYREITYQNYFGVPEHVNVTLKQGGNTLVSAVVNVSLSTSGEVSLSRDIAEVSTDINIVGYNVKVNSAKYVGGSSASASFALSKNGETLVTVTADASGSLYDNGELKSAGKMQANVNILGKVQVKGSIPDFESWKQSIDNAEKYDEDESRFKSYINEANNKMDVGLYFNGSSAASSKLRFEPVLIRDYYGDNYWQADPVIAFTDGSAYSTLTNFFDENTFSTLKRNVETLVDNFTALFNY